MRRCEIMKEASVRAGNVERSGGGSHVPYLEEAPMFHVGLDIHSRRIAVCVLSETGQVARRAQVRTIEEMMRTLEGLPDRFEVCYEASCGYGHYHDVLRPLAARVLVAHPGQLRLIFRSKNKNDRNDAERLAKLLYLGETPAVARLRTIPGVGARTAEAVVAFIDDPHRFRNAKAIGRYFGLVPSQDQSGDRNRLGHIIREGPPVVRQLLAEAAWQALRRSPTVRAYFQRVQRGDPQRKKIALVATGH